LLCPRGHANEHGRGFPVWQDISYEGALARAQVPSAKLLDKALNAGELGFEEGVALSTVDGDDLVALVRTADELRRRTIGEAVTYVVNRNLNFTNVCFVGCGFCGFSRGPKAKDAYFHSTETLIAKSRMPLAGRHGGVIQGGLPGP
jgi:2-iminoacetate synthase ThiH